MVKKQRIAIARALYNSPEILILDEATSSLDSLSEKYVQNAMKKILKNNTAFIIAHRLSSIKLCDKIIVLNKGTIEAIGTHEKLLGQSKTYKKLSMIQNI